MTLLLFIALLIGGSVVLRVWAIPRLTRAAASATGARHLWLAVLGALADAANAVAQVATGTYLVLVAILWTQTHSAGKATEGVELVLRRSEAIGKLVEWGAIGLGFFIAVGALLAIFWLSLSTRYGIYTFPVEPSGWWTRMFGKEGFGTLRGVRRTLGRVALVFFALSLIALEAANIGRGLAITAIRVGFDKATTGESLPTDPVFKPREGEQYEPPSENQYVIAARRMVEDSTFRPIVYNPEVQRVYSVWYRIENRAPDDDPPGGGPSPSYEPQGPRGGLSGRPLRGREPSGTVEINERIGEQFGRVEKKLRECGVPCWPVVHRLSSTTSLRESLTYAAGVVPSPTGIGSTIHRRVVRRATSEPTGGPLPPSVTPGGTRTTFVEEPGVAPPPSATPPVATLTAEPADVRSALLEEALSALLTGTSFGDVLASIGAGRFFGKVLEDAIGASMHKALLPAYERRSRQAVEKIERFLDSVPPPPPPPPPPPQPSLSAYVEAVLDSEGNPLDLTTVDLEDGITVFGPSDCGNTNAQIVELRRQGTPHKWAQIRRGGTPHPLVGETSWTGVAFPVLTKDGVVNEKVTGQTSRGKCVG